MVDASTIDKQFASALVQVNAGGKDAPKLSNSEKLAFYALFKQANIGKCNIPQPSRLKIADRMKWDAWNKLGSMSQSDAKAKFVAEFMKMQPKAKL